MKNKTNIIILTAAIALIVLSKFLSPIILPCLNKYFENILLIKIFAVILPLIIVWFILADILYYKKSDTSSININYMIIDSILKLFALILSVIFAIGILVK